jgi:predicted Fe-Mo cluster-binding NifX family protein
MKICVTSQGKTLGDQVDPRFGRCQFFIIVDMDTLVFEAMENQNAEFSGGAGIQSGQLMAQKGVKAVLTGNVGPQCVSDVKCCRNTNIYRYFRDCERRG